MKDNVIYTCYGCLHYFKDIGDRYPRKHCGKDHFKCPWYWGEAEIVEEKMEK